VKFKKYLEKGMTPLKSDRSKRILAATQDPSAKSDMGKHPIVIGGTKRMSEVYRLPVSLLAFNIRNGRFAAELRAKEKLLGRKLDPLLPEDDEVIRQLLLDQDELATGFLKEDLRKVGQTDPAIITHDGFVINGNRRMAVLQSLHEEDQTGKFEYLEVQVLPEGITEKDLWRIEAGLQLSRDKRLEYGPVNDLLKIREGLRSGLGAAEIAATLYGLKNADEVKEKDKRLALIDSYLTYVGEPDEYTKVNRFVEHFINLQDFLHSMEKKGVKPPERHKWLLRAFEMIRAEMGHMDLRWLRKIAGSPEGAKHFLDSIVPKEGKRTAKEHKDTAEKTKQEFKIAREYVELEQDAKKPEVLLQKAQRAIETLLKHSKDVVANQELHGDVNKLSEMLQQLAAECGKAKPARKRK
jgi:hypothetical protein